MAEAETFYAVVRGIGNSMCITIPANLITFAGIKEGDTLKVMIQNKEK